MNEQKEKRTVRMSLHYSPEERGELKSGADIAGLNANQYFLELHRKGAVVTEKNTLDAQGLRALTTFTNNFNQLTKKVNQLSDGQLNNPKSIELIKDYLSQILGIGKSIRVNISDDTNSEVEELLGLINRFEMQLKNSENANAELRKILSNTLKKLGV